MKVFVPLDAGAVAVGADRVAASIEAEAQRRNRDITIVRTGSRGMFWLEPLVEVPLRRACWLWAGAPEEVASLFDAEFLEGRPPPALDWPWWKRYRFSSARHGCFCTLRTGRSVFS